jgi:hypothetical protein
MDDSGVRSLPLYRPVKVVATTIVPLGGVSIGELAQVTATASCPQPPKPVGAKNRFTQGRGEADVDHAVALGPERQIGPAIAVARVQDARRRRECTSRLIGDNRQIVCGTCDQRPPKTGLGAGFWLLPTCTDLHSVGRTEAGCATDVRDIGRSRRCRLLLLATSAGRTYFFPNNRRDACTDHWFSLSEFSRDDCSTVERFSHSHAI